MIAARFNGPPGTGNGGYSAGVVASAFPEYAVPEVTLRVPPPLDTPLDRRDHGVYAGAEMIARVVAGAAVDDPVPAVPAAQAARIEAERRYPGFADHPFPTCYVCGPERAAGDGLRIFPGPVGDGRTAAPWLVPADVSVETIWAALDCPGGWAIISPGRPYVLGRMAADVRSTPAAGTACVVVGDSTGQEGRKAQTRTALYGPDGALLAAARSIWIAI